MQISDIGMAFIMEGLALAVAMLSLVLPSYLTKRMGQMLYRKARVFLWTLFTIVTGSLLILSNVLLIDTIFYPRILPSIMISIPLGLSGIISLSKHSVSHDTIVSE